MIFCQPGLFNIEIEFFKGVTMKCPKCRFENREGARFCMECGEGLELKCPQCGSPLPAPAKFCDGCGSDLRAPEAKSFHLYASIGSLCLILILPHSAVMIA